MLYIFSILFLSFNILSADNFYNQGLVRSDNLDAVYITIDMCPSSLGINVSLFESIIKLSKQKKQTIPIAIAISGKWINKYPQHLQYLKQLEKDKIIKITWINHGYHHYYNPNLLDQKNFMLHNKSKAEDDILKNQKLMEANDIIPSRFFRFPGLISDDDLLDLLNKHNLIPVGASAWLAKNNGKIKGGDIILIHGNGNEALGVNYFIKLVNSNEFNKYKISPIESIITN